MTTRLALAIALLALGLVALDGAMGWGLGLEAARRGAALIEWVAFWR